MALVLSCANQKGGVGKTTTVINLGACIAEMGYRVLLVDFDPQANLSSGLGVLAPEGVYAVMHDSTLLRQTLKPTQMKGMDVLPSSIDLVGAQVELLSMVDKQYVLKKLLQQLRQDYDFVLIDSPPSLDILTVNSLVASDAVLIPIQCEYYALEGLVQLVKTIDSVKKAFQSKLRIYGILFTMFDKRTRIAREVIDTVIKHFEKKVFSTIIPRNVRLAEAPSHGKAVIQYDPQCLGSRSYRKLAQEVVERYAS